MVAPGISYDYSRIGVNDPETEYALRQTYPGGFISPTEHVTIRQKVQGFEGGIFAITVPGGNYRCLPGPSSGPAWSPPRSRRTKSRARYWSSTSTEHHHQGRGFKAAFSELYKDYIEYKPSIEIKGVDIEKRLIKTESDTIKFDDATIYPGARGSTLIQALGLMDPKSPQKEALIDDHKYNFVGDDHVYVTGDSWPMGFSKSANTANTEGKYVAKVLAARAQGKDIDWASPETICYSMVNADSGRGHFGLCTLRLRRPEKGVRLLPGHLDGRKARRGKGQPLHGVAQGDVPRPVCLIYLLQKTGGGCGPLFCRFPETLWTEGVLSSSAAAP